MLDIFKFDFYSYETWWEFQIYFWDIPTEQMEFLKNLQGWGEHVNC